MGELGGNGRRGGPTGRGPVPPWAPYVRDFASGLALVDAAQLLHPELRVAALDLAAKQIRAASADIIKALKGAPVK